MAFTVSVNHKMNIGNKRVHLISCSVDSPSGNISTGLNVVDHVAICPISMTTAAIVLKKNVGSNSTAINGTINLNAGATGDVFFLTVYGR